MHAIAVKYQIQFAYVLESLIQCLDEYLYQVQYPQIGFLRVDGEYEVEGGIMSVYQFDVRAPFGHGALEVIAEGVGTGRDLLVDATDDGLLTLFAGDVLVEFRQTRLTAVVDDHDALDHSYSLGVHMTEGTGERG